MPHFLRLSFRTLDLILHLRDQLLSLLLPVKNLPEIQDILILIVDRVYFDFRRRPGSYVCPDTAAFPEIRPAERLLIERRCPAHDEIRILQHHRLHVQMFHTRIRDLRIRIAILRTEIAPIRQPHRCHDPIPHTKSQKIFDRVLPDAHHPFRRLLERFLPHLSVTV